MRAVLVGAQGYKGEVQNILGEVPAPTPNTTSGAGAYRAILIEGDSCGDRPPTTLPPPEPIGTLRCSGGGRVHRVADCSRIVALTPRCLARFQSLPDSYPLPAKNSLATKIIGNGVACRAAEAIFGSILK
jgi:site-specific DNA-cytosine methylase